MTPSGLTDALAFLGNHLWQSTVFAAVAALLAMTFRRHHAGVRYWLWLAASAKFVIPFAALVVIGGQFSWRTIDIVPYDNPAVLVEAFSEPFSQDLVTVRARSPRPAAPSFASAVPVALASMWAIGFAALLTLWFVRWTRMRTVTRSAIPLSDGREIDIMQRLAPRFGVSPLPIFRLDTSIEPGVFGILRPVLLWPRGIGEQLTDEQVEAVLA